MTRLIILLLLLATSLLCFFPAPEFHLWYLAIAVTEFPWLFVSVTLVLLIGWRPARFRQAGTLTGCLALLLFCRPIIGAYVAGYHLERELRDAFSKRGSGSKEDHLPFHAWKMVGGIGAPAVPFQTYAYDTVDGAPLTLDWYPSVLQGLRPAVIVIHGGSWSGGDSRQLPELNSYLARQGYQVFSINYRLAPRYLSPAPVEDVASAIRYIKAEQARFQTDTSAFVLLGRSAGAQIALIAAYTTEEPGIRGVINFYGPADMVWGYANPANPLVLNSCKVMEDYLGGSYSQVPGRYIASSATNIVPRNIVPTLTIHGKIDPLVSYGHSPRLNRQLSKYGIPQFTLTLPWATHACDYTLNGPSGQLSTYCVEKFLRMVAPGGK